MNFCTKDYDYCLPNDLIATSPVFPRDRSKMMVLDRQTNSLISKQVFDLPKILEKDTFLVVNNTKVIPSRIIGQKLSGGKIELLLINKFLDFLKGNTIVLKAGLSSASERV